MSAATQKLGMAAWNGVKLSIAPAPLEGKRPPQKAASSVSAPRIWLTHAILNGLVQAWALPAGGRRNATAGRAILRLIIALRRSVSWSIATAATHGTAGPAIEIPAAAASIAGFGRGQLEITTATPKSAAKNRRIFLSLFSLGRSCARQDERQHNNKLNQQIHSGK